LDSKLNNREMLRKKRKLQKRRSLIIFIIIVFAVIILFSAAALVPKLLLSLGRSGSNEGFAVGDPNAPVTVIQFSNYNCGYCKVFSETEEQNLIADYVDPGYVYYQYVILPSNNEASQLASKASHCAADQEKFFVYKDLLYTYNAEVDGFSASNLIKYAGMVKMDTEVFQSCLEGDTYANAYLNDMRAAQSAGVTGTPSFLVNDQLVYATELNETINAILDSK